MFPGDDYVYMSRRGSKKLFDAIKGKSNNAEVVS